MREDAGRCLQVLDASLEAAVLKSDNSALAKDCRKEIKQLNAQLLKLGPRRVGRVWRGRGGGWRGKLVLVSPT